MNLLAIDTSTEITSVALLSGEQLIHQEQSGQKTQAQFLLPMIDALMHEADVQMQQLDGIVFGCGPGSFTGLRIACSVAKGLAFAHDLALIPVSSLASIVWRVRQDTLMKDSAVLAVLDARMHELYWAYYAPEQFIAEERVSPVSEIIVPKNQSVVLAGVGIEEYGAGFSQDIQDQIALKLTLYPNASAMIELVRATGIKAIPASEAQPVYVRNKVTYDKSS
jgi:tRNA threonylcarbamoyladenosine biosynthesis protein TsaB